MKLKWVVPIFCLLAIPIALFVKLPSPDTVEAPKQPLIRSIAPSPTPRVLNEKELWSLVQEWRKENNLKAYREDAWLCAAALKRLDQIKTDWSHDGFYAMQLRYDYVSENLGKDADDAGTLLNTWLESPSHRDNLLKPYKDSCIETEGTYAVQMFANF